MSSSVLLYGAVFLSDSVCPDVNETGVFLSSEESGKPIFFAQPDLPTTVELSVTDLINWLSSRDIYELHNEMRIWLLCCDNSTVAEITTVTELPTLDSSEHLKSSECLVKLFQRCPNVKVSVLLGSTVTRFLCLTIEDAQLVKAALEWSSFTSQFVQAWVTHNVYQQLGVPAVTHLLAVGVEVEPPSTSLNILPPAQGEDDSESYFTVYKCSTLTPSVANTLAQAAHWCVDLMRNTCWRISVHHMIVACSESEAVHLRRVHSLHDPSSESSRRWSELVERRMAQSSFAALVVRPGELYTQPGECCLVVVSFDRELHGLACQVTRDTLRLGGHPVMQTFETCIYRDPMQALFKDLRPDIRARLMRVPPGGSPHTNLVRLLKDSYSSRERGLGTEGEVRAVLRLLESLLVEPSGAESLFLPLVAFLRSQARSLDCLWEDYTPWSVLWYHLRKIRHALLGITQRPLGEGHEGDMSFDGEETVNGRAVNIHVRNDQSFLDRMHTLRQDELDALSEDIFGPVPPEHTRVYHGADAQRAMLIVTAPGVRLADLEPKADFGAGYYLTPHLECATDYARMAAYKGLGAVLAFDLPDVMLTALTPLEGHHWSEAVSHYWRSGEVAVALGCSPEVVALCKNAPTGFRGSIARNGASIASGEPPVVSQYGHHQFCFKNQASIDGLDQHLVGVLLTDQTSYDVEADVR